MGHLIDPCSFLGLALDPDIDEPLGEYAATGQVLMILPERSGGRHAYCSGRYD